MVAVLFGSSFVACSDPASNNPASDGFEFEAPEELYVTEDYNGLSITFIPVSGCTTVGEVEDQIGHGYGVIEFSEDFDFECYFGTRANSVKNRILNNNLYHNNDYIVIRYGNNVTCDEIYRLDVDDTGSPLKATYTSSATVE